MLTILTIVTIIVLITNGKNLFKRENLNAQGKVTSTNNPSKSPDPSPVQPAPPTPWPTPEPMPEESTDPEVLKVSWEDPAVFTGPYAYDDLKKTFVKKDGTTVDYWVFEQGNPVDYVPKDEIIFGDSKEYSDLKGVTTFRGNNYRDSASWGSPTISEKKLEIVWSHDIGSIKTSGGFWPGTGWTGQPLLVNWPEDIRKMMNIKPEMKEKDLVEVIYPTLDGNVYFLDLETGNTTRDKIDIGFPIGNRNDRSQGLSHSLYWYGN